MMKNLMKPQSVKNPFYNKQNKPQKNDEKQNIETIKFFDELLFIMDQFCG